MRLLSHSVSMADVLEATPPDPDTRDVTCANGPYEEWAVDCSDIGRISMQLPDTRQLGPIEKLFADFRRWIETAAEEAPRRRYHCRVDDIRTGGWRKWTHPIVLGKSMQIHDGKHRLLAAYESCRNTASGFEINVYWGGLRRGAPVSPAK